VAIQPLSLMPFVVVFIADLSLLFVVIPESSNRESIKINQFSSFSVIERKYEVFLWQSSAVVVVFSS
jgi:hypothetical protein